VLLAGVFVVLVGLTPIGARAGASAAGSTEAGAGSPAPAATVLKVGFDRVTALLGVQATGADLGGLLRAVAEQSGIPIEVGDGVSGSVTIAFDNLPLEVGIARIVEAAGVKNLAAEYTRKAGAGAPSFQVEKITVLRRGEAAAASPTSAVGVHRRTGRSEGDFGALLREYRNPVTRPERRKALRERIRRASVNTPQEKAELKQALLAAKGGEEIAEDLEPVLLRAMRTYPEASDQEYVLELLRREARPGRLLVSMLEDGDQRYLSHLTQAAEGGSVYAIRVIGMARLKRAAPVLEKIVASPQKGTPAWKAAMESLRRLKAAR
jgi:hypothetical protein